MIVWNWRSKHFQAVARLPHPAEGVNRGRSAGSRLLLENEYRISALGTKTTKAYPVSLLIVPDCFCEPKKHSATHLLTSRYCDFV